MAWIEQHGPRHRIRMRTAKGKRRTVATLDDRESAERMLRALNAELADGGICDPGTLTLAAFGDEWLARRELYGSARRAKVRGIKKERSVWARHVATSELASQPLETIRPADVYDFVQELARKEATSPITKGGVTEYRPTGRTLGREQQKKALRLVRQCLDDAVLRDLVASNPATTVRVPSRSEAADPRDKWTFLTQAEINRVAGATVIPRPKQLLFLTTIYTGMRRGEVFALQWRDVDLEAKRLTVCRSIDLGTKGGGVRRCPLLPMAVEVLTEWRDLLAERGQPVSGDALVFPNRDGRAYGADYTAAWEDKVDRTHGRAENGYTIQGWSSRAGISRHVHFHDLRHTCASHLVMGSWGRAWRLEEVRDFMGHTKISETERYAHLAPQLLDDAAAGTNAAPICPQEVSAPKREPHEIVSDFVGLLGCGLTGSNCRPSPCKGEGPVSNPANLGVPGGHPGGSSFREALRAMVEDRADAPELATEAALDVLREAMSTPEAHAAISVLLDRGERWRSRALDLLELVEMEPGAAESGEA